MSVFLVFEDLLFLLSLHSVYIWYLLIIITIIRPTDIWQKVLRFMVEHFSFFYWRTALSGRGEATHQMCARGSVVGEA